jgi:galactose-1-phosphate uridylyltransferase
MTTRIERNQLKRLLQSENIENIPFDELVRLFREEEGLSDYLPDGIYVTDPRTGEKVIFHSTRANRPHDNKPAGPSADHNHGSCPICQGTTTGVLDLKQLSEGFTFINKNLYPAFYPLEMEVENETYNTPGPGTGAIFGFHFLQWTSSYHDRDWHNIPLSDATLVMKRLAALEEKLLVDAPVYLSGLGKMGAGPQDNPVYVLITKNYGHLVGGSLSHGHQQIALSNAMPKSMADNARFFENNGQTFSQYLLGENPVELIIKDYGPAVLVTPYFMRRPYNMILALKDSKPQYLHQLNDAELEVVAQGWGDAIRAIMEIMPAIGRELAYNVVTHIGPGAGIYFEFLPYTQETGGFELLGLTICQANPQDVARHTREILSTL